MPTKEEDPSLLVHLKKQLYELIAEKTMYGSLPIKFSQELQLRLHIAHSENKSFNTVLDEIDRETDSEERVGWTPYLSSRRIYTTRERLLLQRNCSYEEAQIEALSTEAHRLNPSPNISQNIDKKIIELCLRIESWRVYQQYKPFPPKK